MIKLVGLPVARVNDQWVMALAYAKFYDRRGGTVEIDIKGSKPGAGNNQTVEKEVRRATDGDVAWELGP